MIAADSLGHDDPRAGRSLLTIRESAWSLGFPEPTLRMWARGDSAGRVSRDTCPIVAALPGQGKVATVPFIGIAEAHVLSSFRRRGSRFSASVLLWHGSTKNSVSSTLSGPSVYYPDGAKVMWSYADDAEARDWQPPDCSADRGYLRLYRQTVLQADEGCDLEFLRGRSDPITGVLMHL